MRLELEDVTAGYGETVVLRDVRLVVPAGRVVALLGPNGAGKTTLLSVASGILRPRAGRVLLDGRDVTSESSDARARAGLCHVTEGRSIFPGLTVADNLRMFAPAGREDEAIERAVAATPMLGQRLQQQAGTLSGGQQQLLALSRIYAQEAPTVMFDEVSMGLAPILVDEILEYMRGLAERGHSLLIVEQYVSKALALADLVYVLVRGRLVFAGEPSELADSDILAHYLGAEVAEFGAV